MEFHRYGYRSEQTQPFDDAALHQLAIDAGALNGLDGITGILFVSGNQFVQIVEGGHEAIADLRTRLSRDPRHRNIETLLDEETDTRLFLGWDMRYLGEDDANAVAVATLVRPRPLPDHIGKIFTQHA